MFRMIYTVPLLVMAVVFMSLSAPASAASENIGEIAVIEDVGGVILTGMGASMPNVYCQNAACAFFQNHVDEYDALFIFNNAVTNMQQGWSVQNFNEGIGRPLFDWTSTYCATNGRLRITVSMGNLRTLPFNPDDIAVIVPFYPLTGAELMAHEFGHHWLSAVNFDKGDGQGMQCLLRGYEPSSSGGGKNSRADGSCNGYNTNDFNQHWSYNYNSCSLMYGSCIEDLGGGQFHYSYPLGEVKYSPLDQYLMGLRAPEEVPPNFVVDTGDFVGTSSIPISHSSAGVEKSGARVDVTIEDIIRQEGPRNPATDSCHWKAAFVLIHPEGQPPTDLDLQQMEAYRQRWESFYDWATDERGSFDTTLDGCGIGTDTCAGETSSQCGAVGDCSEGDYRCAGLAVVQVCSQGEWIFSEECGTGFDCKDGVCEPEAVDGDNPTDGDWRADGDDPTDGDKATDGDDPIDGDVPMDGDENEDGDLSGDDMPYDRVCVPDETRCNVAVWQRCSKSGGAWLDVDTCSSAEACQPISGCEDEAGDSGCGSLSGSGPIALLLLMIIGIRLRRRAC